MTNNIRWEIDGEKVEAWINEDQYYCTNDSGNGLFFVDCVKNSRKQLEGTAQFSVRGVKDKKGKVRSWLKEYRSDDI